MAATTKATRSGRLPEGFTEWPLAQQERWLEGFMRDAWRERRELRAKNNSMAEFKTAFLRTLQFEDDPAHPGKVTPEPHNGRARLGINSIAHPSIPENFWTCSYDDALEQAEKIFLHDYWNVLRLDNVRSQDVANKIYDMAVDMGAGTVARYVQGIVGVDRDGVLGTKSMAAINGYDPGKLIDYLKVISRQHYEDLLKKNPEEYGDWREGWMERAER